MEAWGATTGEGLHTSTFLGNPLTCAMALATMDVMTDEGLVARAAEAGSRWRAALDAAVASIDGVRRTRGRGLMLGIPFVDSAGRPRPGAGVEAMFALLSHGFIVSPGGPLGDVLSLSPPLVITDAQLDAATHAIAHVVREIAAAGIERTPS
jgi:4-aminobutyrate aminotransferase-like enzyme